MVVAEETSESVAVDSQAEEKSKLPEINTKLQKTDNKNLLSHFWNLTSLEEKQRLKSTIQIINELKTSDKEEDLDYTVQRLVKGLSSSRKAARQGYATALTQLMIEFETINTDDVFKLMVENLNIKGSFKGQEERDNYFGQLFGVLAICKARLNDGGNIDPILLKQIIVNLLKLSKKKSYLQEVCGKSICDLINTIDYTIYKEHIEETLENVLSCGWNKCTPEILMIILTIEKKFKGDLPKKYFKDSWCKGQLLDESNFSQILPILMETTNISHPKVHVLFNLIFDQVLNHDDETFKVFWKIIVEDGLLESTHARKFLAINLLLNLAAKASTDRLDVMFCPSMLRCIINACQSKDNYLYKAVRDMLMKLPEQLSLNEDKSVMQCMIKKLVGRNGHFSIDSITKTKTVEQLTMKISEDLEEYVDWLFNVFVDGVMEDGDQRDGEKDTNACRSWVISQFVILIRCIKDDKLLTQIASFVFLHAFFTIYKKTKKDKLLLYSLEKALSQSSQQLCQLKFSTIMTELAHKHHTTVATSTSVDGKQHIATQHIGGIAQDGQFYSDKILQFAKKLLDLPKYVTLNNSWTPEVYDVLNKSLDFIEKQNSKDDAMLNMKGTQLLFIHATLQLFSHGEEAIDILNDLLACYEKAEEKRKYKKTEPHWTEVLTEILLGFLVQPSTLMRQVVDIVYPTILPHLTSDAFQLLLNAIKPRVTGEDEAVDVEDDSDLEETKGEDDENDDDKEEFNGSAENEKDSDNSDDDETTEDNNKENKIKKGAAKESDSESEEESSDDDNEIEIDEKFKAELKDALGVNKGDGDSSSEEEEDIDMDTCDPAMLAEIDEKLAAVFRAKKMTQIDKKKKKNTKQSIVHFKLRVLDLVEIFIKKQSKNPLILELMKPLLHIIKSSHGHNEEQAFFERTLGLYKNKLCQLHEYPGGQDVDVEKVHTDIEDLVELAKNASSALFVTYVTQGIVYLMRVLRGTPPLKDPSPLKTRNQRRRTQSVIPEKIEDTTSFSKHTGCLNEERITKCFKSALLEFMTKRSCHLQPILFIEYIQRFPELGWKLANDLSPYLNEGCNNFRKMKALEMIKILLSKKVEEEKTHLNELKIPLFDNTSKLLDSTKDAASCSLKSRQFHDVIQLIDLFIKQAKKCEEEVNIEADTESLKASLSIAIATPLFTRSPALVNYAKKILQTLNGDINATVKTDKKTKKRKR